MTPSLSLRSSKAGQEADQGQPSVLRPLWSQLSFLIILHIFLPFLPVLVISVHLFLPYTLPPESMLPVHPASCTSSLLYILPPTNPASCTSCLMYILPHVHPASCTMYVHPTLCTSCLMNILPHLNPASCTTCHMYILPRVYSASCTSCLMYSVHLCLL
jgi:hypothetical protein